MTEPDQTRAIIRQPRADGLPEAAGGPLASINI